MGDAKPTSSIGRAGQATPYQRSPFNTTPATSSPAPAFRSDIFGQVSSATSAQIYGTSPTTERRPTDRSGGVGPPGLSASTSDPATYSMESRPAPAVVIRRLPRSIGNEALRSMLIFAGDLIDTEFIRSPYPDDQGFATAVARFKSPAGALEAQQKLHGKPNTTKEATMIVEVHAGSAVSALERRNTVDIPISTRAQSIPASAISAGPAATRSRFGNTFQSNDRISPPLSASGVSNGDFPVPESSAHFQNLFSPQSPLTNGLDGQHRVSGKSVINDDAADDETGELLKDPVAYAKSGQHPLTRRTTNPQIPLSRFSSLTLNTNGTSTSNGISSPITNGLSPRGGAAAIQSAISSLSPTNMSGMTINGNYAPNYPRVQYPPVNPADQNPPCNTLYVGNLPIDTSEDELKALFSKQRGYKRLCFRTKQNGPMCFVEFEDVSFATKALHELYGHPLHNSVKGGIRLSFSKNPLGVRSGQTSGMGSNAAMSPQTMSPTYGMMNGGTFSSVSGPPPGLATPPGLVNGTPYRSPPPTTMDSMFPNPYAMQSPEFVNQLGMRQYSGGVPPNLGSGAFGRDGRAGFNEFALGR